MTEERKQQIANEVARKWWDAPIKGDITFLDLNDAILEALTLYEKEGWVSVTERLPEMADGVGRFVLVTDGKMVWQDRWIELFAGEGPSLLHQLGGKVTKWRPLPSPPETH